ncbi:unnamed protein product [Linum tenue]|nr:unnamed protein product [Linum tenue]
MHPHVMKKSQAEVRQVLDKKGMIHEAGLQELSYLKVVVKESLRLYPPAPLLVRQGFQESVLIAGYQIPKKSKIMINVTAISQDPRNWTEPERFYPDRSSNKTFDHKGPNFDYIPFGGERRICPGISFGSIVVDFLLASLLYHFDWKLPNGIKPQDLDMCEKFGSVVTRQNHLHLIPIAFTNPKMGCVIICFLRRRTRTRVHIYAS